jgi:chromosome segregation ATPase
MKLRFFSALFLLLSGLATATAQTPASATEPSPVTRLIQERELLVRQYEAANARRNSLFGNQPSKKDLQEVVESLKGIIRKDTEIVQAVKNDALRRTASIVAEKQQAQQQISVAQTDQSSTRQRFYDLENQIQNLEMRDKQREKKLLDAQAAAKEAEDARTSREMIAVALALLSVALLLYIARLRQRIPAPRARR